MGEEGMWVKLEVTGEEERKKCEKKVIKGVDEHKGAKDMKKIEDKWKNPHKKVRIKMTVTVKLQQY